MTNIDGWVIKNLKRQALKPNRWYFKIMDPDGSYLIATAKSYGNSLCYESIIAGIKIYVVGGNGTDFRVDARSESAAIAKIKPFIAKMAKQHAQEKKIKAEVPKTIEFNKGRPVVKGLIEPKKEETVQPKRKFGVWK